jgi:hypothetical protein
MSDNCSCFRYFDVKYTLEFGKIKGLVLFRLAEYNNE